ncbi:hypothetical protein, partial [Pseudomonas aeruginosa]|uniref:hypothetical protein n=1 Tax=Pseudomonas aeruginosa TaxID=287 RepID=UPI001E425788
FRVRKSEGSAQPEPLAALCRSAEKEVYLERRRGGGTTARAGWFWPLFLPPQPEMHYFGAKTVRARIPSTQARKSRPKAAS